MNEKLNHLQSLADSANAELKAVANARREAKDEFGPLDRHRENTEAAGYKLSAPDAARHSKLTERLGFLAEKHDRVRADYKAKRQLADRCAEVAENA